MKILAALLITAVSALAHAGKTYNYPTVNGLSVDNACYTETTFRSLKPVTYCTETAVVARYACRQGEVEICRPLGPNEQPSASEYLREEYACVSHASKHLEVSRTVTSEKCVKWTPPTEQDMGECLKWETVSEFMGTTFLVEVVDNHGEAGHVSYEKFKVPACK